MISNSFRASDLQNRDNWIILLTERAPNWPNAFAIHYVNAMTIARATVLVFVLRWRVVTNISQQGIRAPKILKQNVCLRSKITGDFATKNDGIFFRPHRCVMYRPLGGLAKSSFIIAM